MALNKEARVKIGVDGADESARDFERIGSAGAAAFDRVASGAAKVGKGLAEMTAQGVMAASGIQKLDLGAAAQRVAETDKIITKSAISTGQAADQLRAKFQALSNQNILPVQEVEAATRSLGKLTYDLKGAQDAYTGVHQAALLFGESDEEQFPFAAALKNLGIDGKDAETQIGKVVAQAEALGTVGGPRALRDLFVATSGQLEMVSGELDKGREKARAFLGVLTQGMAPGQAQRVASGALGFLQGGALDIQRTLGYDVLDRHGHIKNPDKVYQDLFKKMKKRGMSEKSMLMAFRSDLGLEAGSEMYYALKEGRLDKVKEIAGVKPSEKPKEALEDYKKSDAGTRDATDLRLKAAQNEPAGWMVKAGTWLGQKAAENPVAALLTATFGKDIAVGVGRRIFGAAKGGAAAVRGAAGAVAEAGSSAVLGAEELAARAMYQIGPSKVFEGGLKQGALRGAGGALLGMGTTALEVMIRGIASLSKDSELAKQKREAAARGAGTEQAAAAVKVGEITPDIYRRAQSVPGGGQQLVVALQEIAKNNPQALSAVLREQLKAALNESTVKVQVVPTQTPPAQQVENDKRQSGGN